MGWGSGKAERRVVGGCWSGGGGNGEMGWGGGEAGEGERGGGWRRREREMRHGVGEWGWGGAVATGKKNGVECGRVANQGGSGAYWLGLVGYR